MRILFINNDGGGFAEQTEVESGMLVTDFFRQRMPYGDADNFMIRVNRQPVTPDYRLADGDRVTITPTKIQGAK